MAGQNLSFEQLPQLAIAEGATSPDPGLDGVIVYSTTLGVPIWWKASKWRRVSGAIYTDANEISGYLGNLNAQTGTTYTLVAADTGKIVECSNALAITVTFPNSLAVGSCGTLVQGGAGQITCTAASGATIRNRQAQTKTAGQWAALSWYVRTNSGGNTAEYVLAGDTAP